MKPTSIAKTASGASILALLTPAWGVAFFLVPIMRGLTGTISTLVELGILAVIIVTWLAKPHATVFGRYVWPIATVLIAIGAVFAGLNSNVWASIQIGLIGAAVVGLAPIALFGLSKEIPSTWLWVKYGFITGQTLSAVIAFAQWVGFAPLGLSTADTYGRSYGLAAHPNAFAYMAAVAVMLHLAAILQSQGMLRLSHFGGLGLQLVTVIASGSLSAISSLGVGLFIFMLAMRLTLMRVISILAAAVLVVVGLVATGFWSQRIAPIFQERFLTVTGQSQGVASSVDIRQETYAFAWEKIQLDPIQGVGLDSTNSGTFDGRTEVHNLPLHIWYQGGLLAFVAIALVLLVLVAVVVNLIRHGRSPDLAGIITATVTYSFTSAFMLQTYYWLPIAMAVVGATIALREERASRPPKRASSSTLPRPNRWDFATDR